jgi:glycosyltransferase involved in cell wall biosynthesis
MRPRLVYYLDPAGYGGAVKYVERLVHSLDHEEFDVHVVCPTDAEMAPFLDALSGLPVTLHPLARAAHLKEDAYLSTRTPRGLLRPIVALARLPVLREAAKTGLAAAALATDSRTSRRVHALLAEIRPTLLHVNCDHFPDRTGRLAMVVGHRAGARGVVATIHQRPQPPVFPRALSHYYDRRALRAADRTIVLSRRFVPLLREGYAAPAEALTIVYNGSPASCFEQRPSRLRRRDLGLAEDAVLVTHVGTVIPARGQIVLAQALVSLLESCPRLEAVFVGRGTDAAYTAALQDLIARQGAGRLRWIGHRDDAVEVMRLADIAAVSSFQEAHPFALLEAMATARAIVTTDVGAVPETVEDDVSALVVLAGDVEAMAAGIRRLHDSAPLRQRLGEAARRTALERFTEERMVRETVGLYRALVGRP